MQTGKVVRSELKALLFWFYFFGGVGVPLVFQVLLLFSH